MLTFCAQCQPFVIKIWTLLQNVCIFFSVCFFVEVLRYKQSNYLEQFQLSTVPLFYRKMLITLSQNFHYIFPITTCRIYPSQEGGGRNFWQLHGCSPSILQNAIAWVKVPFYPIPPPQPPLILFPKCWICCVNDLLFPTHSTIIFQNVIMWSIKFPTRPSH